jgi:hypothetical protein
MGLQREVEVGDGSSEVNVHGYDKVYQPSSGPE